MDADAGAAGRDSGAGTREAGTGAGLGKVKPDGGPGGGRGPAILEIPAGKMESGKRSSSVRKSSSVVGEEGQLREKGNVVSSKTTWREMMTRLVVRSRHR